ncbi:MAG: hypothetical protein NTX25_24155 [Proteobacteria bacterium]|nr:hypothetical protein [Pseudomonadota bacterium]
MSTYRSDDGKSFFEVEKTDFCDANGSKTYGFRFGVESRGFAGCLSDVWFYDEDLVKFISNIADLTSGKAKAAKLQAMSDFALTVIPTDNIGHFSAKFSLANASDENSADLTVKIETHLLDELATELKSVIDRAIT